MTPRTIKRLVGRPVGGEPHGGWLPPNAAVPLPTPVRPFDFAITSDGQDSFLLEHRSQDGTARGDTWHGTLAAAVCEASECFGIDPAAWQDVDEEAP